MQSEGGLCGREVLRATVCCTSVYRLPVVPRMMGCLYSEQRGMRRVFTLVSVSLVPLTVSSLPPSTELGDICFSRRGGPNTGVGGAFGTKACRTRNCCDCHVNGSYVEHRPALNLRLLTRLGRLKSLSQFPAPALEPDTWEGNSETDLLLPNFICWEALPCLWLLPAVYLSFP